MRRHDDNDVGLQQRMLERRRFRLGLLLGAAVCLVAATAWAFAGPAPSRATLAWPSGPLEVHLSFDHPIDPGFAAHLVSTEIHLASDIADVSAWRRRGMPPLKPPAGTLKVAGARVVDGGRTLVLATDPHPRQSVYVLESQFIATPVAYDLTGAAVSWSDDRPDSMPSWQGWWPDLDPSASRALTRGSVEHEQGFARLVQPGRVSLESLVVLPKGPVKLRIAARGLIEASLDGENPAESGGDRAEFGIESTGEPSLLLLKVRSGDKGRPFAVRITYQREGETSETTLPRERQLVPWSPAPVPEPSALTPPEFPLTGGDPKRGEAVFFSEQAKCSTCHKVGGRGGNVGPDLSALASRRPLDLYRDIAEPSATINPDYVPYTVSLKDGRIAVGIVRAVGADSVQVTDTEAKATQFPRAEIDELRPGTTSIMPVGLAGAIGEASIRDLIAFLTSRSGSQAAPGTR